MADEVVVRMVRQGAPTSTGTQDYTVSGAGTCKGAIFLMVGGTSDDAEAGHQRKSVGMTDGNLDRCNFAVSRDNVGTVRSRHGATNGLIAFPNVGADSFAAEADFDSFITDGVRINWVNAPGNAHLVTAILFFGDVTVDVSAITTDTTVGNSTSVTSANRKAMFFVSTEVAFGSGGNFTADSRFYLGMASRGSAGTTLQRCFSMGTENGTASTAIAACCIWDNRYMMYQCDPFAAGSPGGPVTDYAWEIENWDDSGYDVTTRYVGGGVAGTAPQIRIAALMLNIGERTTEALEWSTPTTTGVDTVGTTNFLPSSAFGFVTHSGAARGVQVTNDNAGKLAFSMFNDSGEEFSLSTTEDISITSGNTNVDSINKSSAVVMEESGGARDMLADFDSFNDTGFALDWTTADGFARKAFHLLIERVPLVEFVDEAVTITEDVGQDVVTSSVAFTEGVDEDVTITEDAQRAIAYARTIDEAVEITEDVGLGRGVFVDEAVTVTEEAVQARDLNRVIDEPVTIKENAVRYAGWARFVDEAVDITETVEEQLGQAQHVDESITITEAVGEALLREPGGPRKADNALAGSEEGGAGQGGSEKGSGAIGGSEVGSSGVGGSEAGSDPRSTGNG